VFLVSYPALDDEGCERKAGTSGKGGKRRKRDAAAAEKESPVLTIRVRKGKDTASAKQNK
jgi:hypothetical protein